MGRMEFSVAARAEKWPHRWIVSRAAQCDNAVRMILPNQFRNRPDMWMRRVWWRRRPAGGFAACAGLKSRRQDAGATRKLPESLDPVCNRRQLGPQFEKRLIVASLQPGQAVRVNLAGLQAGSVLFHAAVTAAVGHIVRQTSENPPTYLVRLLFSFRGVTEVEVPEDRITAT